MYKHDIWVNEAWYAGLFVYYIYIISVYCFNNSTKATRWQVSILVGLLPQWRSTLTSALRTLLGEPELSWQSLSVRDLIASAPPPRDSPATSVYAPTGFHGEQTFALTVRNSELIYLPHFFIIWLCFFCTLCYVILSFRLCNLYSTWQ